MPAQVDSEDTMAILQRSCLRCPQLAVNAERVNEDQRGAAHATGYLIGELGAVVCQRNAHRSDWRGQRTMCLFDDRGLSLW